MITKPSQYLLGALPPPKAAIGAIACCGSTAEMPGVSDIPREASISRVSLSTFFQLKLSFSSFGPRITEVTYKEIAPGAQTWKEASLLSLYARVIRDRRLGM